MSSSTSSPADTPARPRVLGYAAPKAALPAPSASRSTSLSVPQARDLVNALSFAETLLPKDTAWVHATIVLEQSADFIPGDARAYMALQRRVLRRIGDFLRRYELPAMHLGVREIGPKTGRHHTHLLLPLHPHLRPEMEAAIRDAGRLQDLPNNLAVVLTPPERDKRGLHTPSRRRGVLMDFLKTMSPKAIRDGVRIMDAIGIDNRGQVPCVIHGKRTVISRNLHRKARADAGWRELDTEAELQAALGGVIEAAGKESNRQKQRRHRARKAAGRTMPPPSKTVLPKPDPFDVSDLAADFFE